MNAAHQGNVAIVEMLLHAGATTDAYDCRGRTARDTAEMKWNWDVVQLIDAWTAPWARARRAVRINRIANEFYDPDNYYDGGS